MADYGYVDDLGRDWLWTERHFEDAGSEIADGASSAYHWTGRQLAWAGSGIAQSGVAVLGWTDSRTMPYVMGHFYDTVIPMGTFPNVTPAALLERQISAIWSSGSGRRCQR